MQCGLRSRLEFLCMYVCIHMYFRCRTCLRIRARVHVLRKYDVRIRICVQVLGFMCLACVGPAMRATCYIHTYDIAAHCAVVARRHRYSGAMSSHVRMYAYLGLHVLHALGQP